MKKIFVCLTAAALIAVSAGCRAAGTVARGISEKAVSGDGYIGYSKTGFDAVTGTPVFNAVLVKGSYTSIPAGMEFIEYTESTDSSIFNTAAKSCKRRIVFGSSDRKHLDAVLDNTRKMLAEPLETDDKPVGTEL